ncbi:MAG: hypothetical protein KAS23_09545, partial [Anaerohalosphaera sp.]|nr:hypothetical protein [Anaerohalosphaera sp.]
MRYRITIRFVIWLAVIIMAIVVFSLNKLRTTGHPETLSEYDVKMIESCVGMSFPPSTTSIKTFYDGHDSIGFLCIRFDIIDLEAFLASGNFYKVTKQISKSDGSEYDLDSLEYDIWTLKNSFNAKPERGLSL